MTLATLLSGALLLLATGSGLADPPTPVNSPLFAFPSVHPGPGSARSAGVALADRWLGDEPWGNPAWADTARVALTGALLHMNRQDLAADSRAFDQQSAVFEAGGGLIGGAFGRFGLAA